MVESLRARLLLWYTAILATVMIVSGATACYLAWRSQLTSIDAALSARANALAAGLRPTEPGAFDLVLPAAPPAIDGVVPQHALWTASGNLIDRSDPDLIVERPATSGTWTRAGRRELAVQTPLGPTVLVGMDLSSSRRHVQSLAVAIAVVGGAAIVLSLAAGWWLIGRALAPAGRISRTARAMVDGDFGARIPIERVETEFGQLAGALNDAFDRLHASLERQRRFTADASHELRTPLATVSTEAEWALARPRSPAEYVMSIEAIERAALRMRAVVERLLALARADAGAETRRQDPIAIDTLIAQAVNDLAPLAERRHVRVNVSAPSALVSFGDPDRLLDAVTNVLTNAVQYSPDGGTVTVTAARRGDWIDIDVGDQGPGIAPGDLPRVFEPFFRADPARQRDPGGAGLGLAIAKASVEAAGGAVACASEPGRGTTVSIRLPVTQP